MKEVTAIEHTCCYTRTVGQHARQGARLGRLLARTTAGGSTTEHHGIGPAHRKQHFHRIALLQVVSFSELPGI